jgi:hypothetical protein
MVWQVGRTPGGEVIQNDHLPTLGEQVVDEM